MDSKEQFEEWHGRNASVPLRELMFRLWRDNRELLAKVIKLEEELGQWRRDAKQSYEELRK